MNAPDGGRGEPAADFAEQFFERQRRETLDRIQARQTRRRAVRVAVPLAATVLVAAVLVGTGALRGRGAAPSEADWLFAWSASEVTTEDPLAAFGPWTTAEAKESEADLDSLLPPLPADFPVVTDPLGES